jgi:hypothetical protein
MPQFICDRIYGNLLSPLLANLALNGIENIGKCSPVPYVTN